MPTKKPNRVKRALDWVNSRPIPAGIVLVGMAVIALSTFTSALDSLKKFASPFIARDRPDSEEATSSLRCGLDWVPEAETLRATFINTTPGTLEEFRINYSFIIVKPTPAGVAYHVSNGPIGTVGDWRYFPTVDGNARLEEDLGRLHVYWYNKAIGRQEWEIGQDMQVYIFRVSFRSAKGLERHECIAATRGTDTVSYASLVALPYFADIPLRVDEIRAYQSAKGW